MSTLQDFANALAADLGIDNSNGIVTKWVTLQAQYENTSAANNPLATTQVTTNSIPLPGNTANVQQYPTLQEGAAATAQTLTNGNYPNILTALRSGSFFNIPGIIHDLNIWGTTDLSNAISNNPSLIATYTPPSTSPSLNSLAPSDITTNAPNVGLPNPFSGLSSGVSAVVTFIKKILDYHTWLKIGFVMSGGILIIMGIFVYFSSANPQATQEAKSDVGKIAMVAAE